MKRRVLDMRYLSLKACILVIGLVALGLPSVASAGPVTFTIAPWDTSPLIGNGPFALAFQLTDGSQTGDGNNSVTISNINMFGGAPGGMLAAPYTTGNVSGGLGTSVTLRDTAPTNEFAQVFTPGQKLSFTVTATTNADAGSTPDAFAVLIYGADGQALPTQDFLGSSFISLNLTGSDPIQLSATDPSSPVALDAPQIATPVPEPATLTLIGVGLASLAVGRRFRGRVLS
jgi:hypothetical protein